MNMWYASSLLVGLPGVPGTVQGVNSRSKRENWKSRKREARGGGHEFHIDSLPEETRRYLQDRAAAELAIKAAQNLDAELATAENESRSKRKQKGIKKLSSLRRDHPGRLKAEACFWILRRWQERAEVRQCSLRACADDFVVDVMSGDLSIPSRLRKHLPKRDGLMNISRPTLYRWLRDYKAQGLGGLVSNYGGRKGTGIIDQSESMQQLIVGCMLQQPHITPSQVTEYLQATHSDQQLPSISTICRWMKAWKRDNHQLWVYMTNPDLWKNTLMSAQGSHHENVYHLNQQWELDSTPADWMLKDGRHSVIGVIDMYSRRLKLRVSKTSTAASICALMRSAIIDWGKPDLARTDNGKDYTSIQLTESLYALDITHDLCPPFASEAKGTVERAFRTMAHGILEMLPGFIGHNVAERKVIEARKSFAQRVMTKGEVIQVEMTADELQETLNQWVDFIYSRNPHSGLNGRTPLEQAAHWKGTVKSVDERALDFLLYEEIGSKKITKKGIRMDHHWYVAVDQHHWAGEWSRVKRDPDSYATIYVYSEVGDFLFVAQCPELTGIDRKEVATAAKHSQKKFIREQKAEYSEHKKAVKKNIAQVVLEHRIEQSEKVSYIQPPSEEFDNHALQQARKAAEAKAQMDADLRDITAQLEHPDQEKIAEVSNDPTHRYQRWMRVQSRIANGEHVEEEERTRLLRYLNSDEYRSMQQIAGDFKDFDFGV